MWTEAFENTLTLLVKNSFTNYSTSFIQGCKNCNEVVDLQNMYKERQLVGNCYQSLCNCPKCGKGVIFDERQIRLLNFLLNK